MTAAPDVAAIAKGLTGDGRQHVHSAPPSWFNLPADHPMSLTLRFRRLVSSYRHQYASRHSMRLNDLGLAVRQHLIEAAEVA